MGPNRTRSNGPYLTTSRGLDFRRRRKDVYNSRTRDCIRRVWIDLLEYNLVLKVGEAFTSHGMGAGSVQHKRLDRFCQALKVFVV